RTAGALAALLMLMKGQPLAYNKDNQEDKEAARKAANIIIDFGGLDKIMDFFHSNYAA
ncbi:MAG: argininosuccinate lyase, partial [Betaproteobacteria bacterium]|nr:argininosuccinate lyase [Betaproteobacteria bacterium]